MRVICVPGAASAAGAVAAVEVERARMGRSFSFLAGKGGRSGALERPEGSWTKRKLGKWWSSSKIVASAGMQKGRNGEFFAVPLANASAEIWLPK